MRRSIPFNKPYITGDELRYISQAIVSGNIASDGPFTQRCSRLLEERFDVNRVFMTPSCTAALEMAAMLCDLVPGDEVILPSFTFPSTANAIIRLGCHPVFVDIRPDTLNLDESLIEQAITHKTKAIFAVHYAGVGCEMDRIMSIALEHNLLVVEDAAQGVNSFYKGRALGSIGHFGAYSFHHSKNYTCGEGGAISVNSPDMVALAEMIREKGTDRSKFLRGEIDKYTWVEFGSSYVPSEIVSAFLCAQLEMLDEISVRRRRIYDFYYHQLKPLEGEGLLRLPTVPEDCQTNSHLFYILLPNQQVRDALMAHLNENHVGASFHFVPLHSSPMGRRFGDGGHLPVTEGLSARLLRLPLYPQLLEEEQLTVVDLLKAFL